MALLPWVVQAQNEPPNVVMGTAFVNGVIPAAGTEITAHAGTMQVGSAVVKAGGSFRIDVMNPQGQIVTFMVGGVKANQSLDTWTSGMINRGFDLSASSQRSGCQAGLFEPTFSTRVHTHELPHVFIGKAVLNGGIPALGTEVTAWDGSTKIGTTHTSAGGLYIIQVARAYGPVPFKLGGITAGQSYAQWRMGHITTDFDLTATASSTNCLEGRVPVEMLVNVLKGQVLRVFAFDNATKQWQFYDPQIAEFSDLELLIPGRPYYFLIDSDFDVLLNGSYRQLSCSYGNCWNILVW